jgi:hypothetical protein
MSKRQKAKAIDEPFIMLRLSMLVSPAFMVLSLAARRVLARIEIEHMQHGGQENGNLQVTYDQFEDYGIPRHSIGPAIRELEALGLIEITEHGRAGNREYRRPSKYRLTYCAAKGAMGNGTHEWRGITMVEQAKKAAASARRPVKKARRTAAKAAHPAKQVAAAARPAPMPPNRRREMPQRRWRLRRPQVLAILKDAPGGLPVTAIAEAAGLHDNRNCLDVMLFHMAKDGEIKRLKRGVYSLPKP